MGRALVLLHWISGALVIAAALMGYIGAHDEASVGAHVWTGFLFALVIGFTHAMTIFWFAGMGVGMREAAGGKPGTAACLEKAAALRRRIALPLGVALVSLMTAVILGGGSHTRALSGMPHHVASIVAVVSGLAFNLLAVRSIGAYESLVHELEAIIGE